MINLNRRKLRKNLIKLIVDQFHNDLQDFADDAEAKDFNIKQMAEQVADDFIKQLNNESDI